MAQVRWEQTAQDDVLEIYQYIAQDSRAAAAALVRRIRNGGRWLARHPEMGRIVPEYNDPQYREVIVAPYRVIYRYFGDQDIVRILTVVHGSRMLPSIRGY